MLEREVVFWLFFMKVEVKSEEKKWVWIYYFSDWGGGLII